jgi:hypothetical protein
VHFDVWDLALGAAILAWSVAFLSLAAAKHMGRKASRHLPPAKQNNYLRNVMLFPRGSWVEPLLKGQRHELHAAVVAHARRAHMAMIGFLAVIVLALVIVAASGTRGASAVACVKDDTLYPHVAAA